MLCSLYRRHSKCCGRPVEDGGVAKMGDGGAMRGDGGHEGWVVVRVGGGVDVMC